MTKKANDGNLVDLVAMCKANGFDEDQTSTIVAMYEYLVPPIMQRYEKELAYAAELWNADDPNAQKMVRIASANSALGQAHINRCITFGQEFDVSYINPAEHIPNYPH